MRNARPTSLLEFAIAASLAIVPILFGVVLLVAGARPDDPGAAPAAGSADRYLSVRQLAALKTFEAAVVERGTPHPPPDAAALLDALPACRADWQAPGGLREAAALSAWGRWIRGGAAEPSPADRIAARLVQFDAALERFSTRTHSRTAQPLAFDAARWFAAANQALASPLASPAYPGRPFALRCADLDAALAALLRNDARMLDALAWRGSESSTVLARWQPGQQLEIAAHQVARRSPWSGLAGCVYLGRRDSDDAAPTHFVAGPRSLQRRLCGTPALAGPAAAPPTALAGEPGPADPPDDPRWGVPPSLQAMLAPLDTLRQPGGALVRSVTEAADAADAATDRPRGNRALIDGSRVDIGLSVVLTIDPALQALAQRTAACYTGRHEVCAALGLVRREDAGRPIGQALLEGAMVRMAAVAVIDVASGRIEALAGALSRCARQAVDGPGRDADCDTRLPYPVQYRADALLNPAVFHDAMPASTVKPIMAAAFLSDPTVGARWLEAERAAAEREAAKPGSAPPRDSLRGQLLRSDSARFLDRMFCLDQGFAGCERPWAVQRAAAAFGWNAGCAEGEGRGCGRHDLLFGAPDDARAGPVSWGRPPAPQLRVAYGRLMTQPVGERLGAPMQLRPPARLNPAILRRCAAGADGRRTSDDDWEKCRGGAVVDVVAEGWGQGHARASALGSAGMMAALAAAANGQDGAPRPHLVESVRGVGGGAASPAIDALGAALARGRDAANATPRRDAGDASLLRPEAASLILAGLAHSHRIGTARSACEQVFDAQRCREIGWIAGKTGTPSFPNDGVSLDEIARRCPRGRAGVATPAAGAPAPACSSLRPYKWYVAAWRSDGSAAGPWDKAIAVLAERNWVQRSGQVHGAGDHGPNPAAEIALQIVGRRLGLLGNDVALAGAGPGAAR